jgi:TolA-binding protein
MSPSLSGRVLPSSSRSSRRIPLLGALITGLLLLGMPTVTEAATKKKSAPARKKEAPPQASSQEQELHSDAARLLRAKQYAEAETLAKRCIDATPNSADCHMLRGAALAGLSNWAEAAEEYRTFLRLAPDHTLAPKVRETLDNYEKQMAPPAQ